MTEKNVATSLQDITDFICHDLEKVNPDKIDLNENTDITTDLSVDSLAVMDLMFAIEEHFDVSIALNDLADIRKVSELTALVMKAVQEG